MPENPFPGKRATIHDVARSAGVSASTVSLFLSGKGSVSDTLAEKVRSAVAELSFQPNVHARALRTSAAETVYVVGQFVQSSDVRIVGVYRSRAEASRAAAEASGTLLWEGKLS